MAAYKLYPSSQRMVITDNLSLQVNRAINITATLVAGGGAGGLAMVQSNVAVGGGGGGGGEARQIVNISVASGDIIVAEVGKGGDAESIDGGDGGSTTLMIKRGNVILQSATVAGGKGADFGEGGAGGSTDAYLFSAGSPGANGEATPSDQTPNGGSGGVSPFSLSAAAGGNAENVQGGDGSLGGGGGGGAPGTSQASKGGNGVVILEY